MGLGLDSGLVFLRQNVVGASGTALLTNPKPNPGPSAIPNPDSSIQVPIVSCALAHSTLHLA